MVSVPWTDWGRDPGQGEVICKFHKLHFFCELQLFINFNLIFYNLRIFPFQNFIFSKAMFSAMGPITISTGKRTPIWRLVAGGAQLCLRMSCVPVCVFACTWTHAFACLDMWKDTKSRKHLLF